tara:strand:+ start:148 stop:327 length:180 start_codon:yes stop_codon:yes gene_type:complete
MDQEMLVDQVVVDHLTPLVVLRQVVRVILLQQVHHKEVLADPLHPLIMLQVEVEVEQQL